MATYAVLGTILSIIVALFGLIAWSLRTGGSLEKLKQDEADLKAREIADQVQNDVGAMPPKAARDELKGWSPK